MFKYVDVLLAFAIKVPINVYEGDRPVCQCHNEQDAKRIVDAMNAMLLFLALVDKPKP